MANTAILEALKAQFPQLFTTRDGAAVLDLEKVRLTAGEGNYKDKYGLRWENKPEHFDKVSLGRVPVLRGIPEKSLSADAKKPSHVLIQGDNYHALQVLQYTHAGAIDVIIVDPPYSTGNKDFKYNDKFVDKEDGYRHSKWLSFMSKRLKLAKTLLKDTGVIFLSIDDNEQSQLKLLCDDIFLLENWVATVPVITNLKGNNDQFGFAGTHEYVLCYAKSKGRCGLTEISLEDDESSEWAEDAQGLYKVGANLKASGQDGPREKRPNLFFPLYVSPTLTTATVRQSPEDEEVWPITDGKEMRWRWQKSTFERDAFDVIVSGSFGSRSIYKKQRPQLGDLPSKKPKSVLYSPAYSTGTATAELKDLFNGERLFNGPKSTKFIKDLLQMSCPDGGVVLDFFAGSGTTAHAVMQLNAETGTRQCILATNDEGEFKDNTGALLQGGICTNVTHPRVQKVIRGYTTPKGKAVPGLGGNLAFFETAFHDEPRTRGQMAEFFKVATDVLCLKASCFDPVNESPDWRVFKSATKTLFVFFDDIPTEALESQVEAITGPVDLYTFAYDDGDDMAEHFARLPNVTVHEIPRPLLDLYKRNK